MPAKEVKQGGQIVAHVALVPLAGLRGCLKLRIIHVDAGVNQMYREGA